MPKQKVRKFVSTEEEMQSIGFRASLYTENGDEFSVENELQV